MQKEWKKIIKEGKWKNKINNKNRKKVKKNKNEE